MEPQYQTTNNGTHESATNLLSNLSYILIRIYQLSLDTKWPNNYYVNVYDAFSRFFSEMVSPFSGGDVTWVMLYVCCVVCRSILLLVTYVPLFFLSLLIGLCALFSVVFCSLLLLRSLKSVLTERVFAVEMTSY